MEHYNFEPIGKKMPYRVPDSFFDNVEESIIAKARNRQKRRRIFKISYGIVAAAAIFAFILIVAPPDTPSDTTDFAAIAQAFDNLSEADQTYLLEMYQDDIFINE